MTIPTPTSDGIAALAGGVAPGLPDLSVLAQLAGELFATLPSGGVDAKLPFGSRPPQPAQTELALGSRAPALAPAQAGHGAPPEAAVDAAPAAGRAGRPVLGVPEAYAAAIPKVTSPHGPNPPGLDAPGVPSSPYYFLAESSALQSVPGIGGNAPEVPDDRITAQSFGLPGAAELQALLATPTQPAASANAAQAGPAAPSFYFLELPTAEAVPQVAQGAHPPFDVQAVRRDFHILGILNLFPN